MTNYRDRIQVVLLAGLLLVLSLACWLGEDKLYSESERRVLTQQPELTAEALLSGSFTKDFESWTLDQFPGRDGWRQVKAFAALDLFRQKDNNDLYQHRGHLSKLEYPYRPYMLENAANKMQSVYDRYLKEAGGKVYFSIVPDKNRVLAGESGRLSLDYDQFAALLREKTDSFAAYIDLYPLLEEAGDYYRTDSHWQQPQILDVARTLGEAMGLTLEGEYEEVRVNCPFYGVWYGQAALPGQPDELAYLTNDELEQCTVTVWDTGLPVEIPMYDLEKALGRDPYDLFLNGAVALLTIENPAADPDRELILFRDSFGSSLAPLLAEGYGKITLIDLRYINSAGLDQMVDFEGADVLFLYSTLLLNNSTSLR